MSAIAIVFWVLVAGAVLAICYVLANNFTPTKERKKPEDYFEKFSKGCPYCGGFEIGEGILKTFQCKSCYNEWNLE
ncbi:MAG: hypothetical protein ABFQ53_00395 [Patescibacteria group bacterium]